VVSLSIQAAPPLQETRVPLVQSRHMPGRIYIRDVWTLRKPASIAWEKGTLPMSELQGTSWSRRERSAECPAQECESLFIRRLEILGMPEAKKTLGLTPSSVKAGVHGLQD